MRDNFFHGILLAAASCAALASCQTSLSAPANRDAGGAIDVGSAKCYNDDDCGPGKFCEYGIAFCGASSDGVNAGGKCHTLVCSDPGCSDGVQCRSSYDCDPFSSCEAYPGGPMVCKPIPLAPEKPLCNSRCASAFKPYVHWVCLCPDCKGHPQ